MNLIDRVILEWSYKTKKGYPDLNNEEDLRVFESLFGFDLSEETTESLAKVNAALWIVEDALRDHEARQDFGLQFTLLARQVYQLNDQRHELKQRINRGVGCVLQEEKAYLKYSKSSFDP